jgi:hypothetical protein
MKDPQRYRALEGCSPVTAIRAGDTDENDATAADVAWESFLNTRAVDKEAEVVRMVAREKLRVVT